MAIAVGATRWMRSQGAAATVRPPGPWRRVTRRAWAWVVPERPLARQVLGLAWPAIAHMGLVTLVFTVQRALVSRYDQTALASMQISGTLVWTAYAVFTAFSAGTLAVVARRVGAGEHANAARAARSAIVLAFGLGLLVVLPVRIANGNLLELLFPTAGAAVRAQASAYLHVVLPVLPFAFVEAIAAASLQGSGDTKTPLAAAALGNLVNLAVSATLIPGRFGLPELGVEGAALGAAAAALVEASFLVARLGGPRSSLAVRDPALGRWLGPADREELWRVLAVSGPAFAEKALYHAGYLGFVTLIGLLGSVAMAANQAVVSIEAIAWLSADGFGIAAGALVAQKLGAGRPVEAQRAGVFAAAAAAGVLSAFGLAFALAPELLLAPFDPTPELASTGRRALLVAAIAQPFMAVATVLAMALRGAGATRTVLGVTVLGAVVVRLGATTLFAFGLDLGLPGVWLGSTTDWVVRALVLAVVFARGRFTTLRV